jgi:hypothetical protein
MSWRFGAIDLVSPLRWSHGVLGTRAQALPRETRTEKYMADLSSDEERNYGESGKYICRDAGIET